MARPGRPRKHDPVTNGIRRYIRNADDDAAKKLIAANDIDIPDGEGCTPLIWAAFHNRPKLLQWIIEQGANVNHQDSNGYCALHYVAQEKLDNVTQILLDADAATELRDVYGNTPLWTARSCAPASGTPKVCNKSFPLRGAPQTRQLPHTKEIEKWVTPAGCHPSRVPRQTTSAHKKTCPAASCPPSANASSTT